MSKPILCLDFDGVIHSYASGWKGADVIPDPPVDGAMKFIWEATEYFRVVIFSSRSHQSGGINAMQKWLSRHFLDFGFANREGAAKILGMIEWPTEKPAAMVTLDDRALTFEGVWPALARLQEFQPWNKRALGATGTFSLGKIDDSDEGDLKLGVAFDKLNGIVRVDFGKPVAWLGMPPEQAIQFGKLLLKNAGAKKVEITL